MKVPIKSAAGIETYMFSFQVSDYDTAKGVATVVANLSQADSKEFQSPDTTTVSFPLTEELSAQLIAAVVEEYNNPAPAPVVTEK